MSLIEILYPNEKAIVYGNTLTFRYNIKNNLKSNYLTNVVVKLDNSDEVRIPWKDKRYLFESFTSGDHILTGYLEDNKGNKINNSDFKISFIGVSEKYEVNNPVWSVITNKLPTFIRDDYKTFTSFIEAYFEWLHKSNNPIYSIYSSGDFSDVDTSPEIFLELFRTNYLNDFPVNILNLKNTLNIKNVIKNIKQYYSAKGSEKAYKFLFRLLYKTYVEIEYPRDYILKASGNIWVENKFLKVRGFDALSPDKIKNSIIYQYSKTEEDKIVASARILDVIIKKIENESIYELKIENIIGKFGVNTGQENFDLYNNLAVVGEEVFIDVIDDGKISRQKVYLIENITGITITTPGLVPGDIISVEPIATTMSNLATGNSFYGLVSSVGTTGIPSEIRIVNTGYDYRGDESNFTIYLKRGTTLTELDGSISFSKVFFEPGYYETTVSSPSSSGILQDNRKYQELSYVLKAGIQESEFIDVIKRLIHPAGFAVFTEPYIQKYEDSQIIKKEARANLYYKPIIGNHIAHQFNSSINVRRTGYKISDLFPHGYDPSVSKPDQTYPTSFFVHEPTSNGAINTGVEYIKFAYSPPLSDFDKRNEYWVVYPNFSALTGQQRPLKDLKIKEILEILASRVNLD